MMNKWRRAYRKQRKQLKAADAPIGGLLEAVFIFAWIAGMLTVLLICWGTRAR